MKPVLGRRVESQRKSEERLYSYLCNSNRVCTAVAQPGGDGIGVPSGLANCTVANVVTNSSGDFISIVCTIVWILTNVPFSVINAMLLALYE